MDETVIPKSTPKTAAEYRAAIDELLADMMHLNTRIQTDQSAIDLLKVETRQIAAHIEIVLSRLEAQMDALQLAG